MDEDVLLLNRKRNMTIKSRMNAKINAEEVLGNRITLGR